MHPGERNLVSIADQLQTLSLVNYDDLVVCRIGNATTDRPVQSAPQKRIVMPRLAGIIPAVVPLMRDSPL